MPEDPTGRPPAWGRPFEDAERGREGGEPTGTWPGPRPGQPADSSGRPLSAWWKRAVAIVVDMLVVGIPTSLLLSGLGLRVSVSTRDNHVHIGNTGAYFQASLIQLIILLAYFSFLDGSPRGQTLGKMLMHISTRDARTGGSVGHSRALARRLLYVLLFYLFLLPGIINALWPLRDRHRQAFHDKAVGSVVVDVE
jgi:uncharacterized RDD family membrane protein YckC